MGARRSGETDQQNVIMHKVDSFSVNIPLPYQCKQMLLHIWVFFEPRGRGFAKGGCRATW